MQKQQTCLAIFLIVAGMSEGLRERRLKAPITVFYIEVNIVNFANLGCYTRTIQNDTQLLFDIGIIFAATINYNVKKKEAFLYFNPNVQTVLDNVNTYVRPLQKRGMKVLLSLLGNHQGAGISNFATVTAARNFAKLLNNAVRKYGLDGIDFDDEWSEYGKNGTPKPNRNSFLWLLRELRNLMPDKIISFFFCGAASESERLQNGKLIAGDYLDYSWNPAYGTYIPPEVPNTKYHQLSAAAVQPKMTKATTAQQMAKRTIADGYGAFLYYDLPYEDYSKYFSGVSKIFYGIKASLTPNCLLPWPPAGTPAVRGPRERMRLGTR